MGLFQIWSAVTRARAKGPEPQGPKRRQVAALQIRYVAAVPELRFACSGLFFSSAEKIWRPRAFSGCRPSMAAKILSECFVACCLCTTQNCESWPKLRPLTPSLSCQNVPMDLGRGVALFCGFCDPGRSRQIRNCHECSSVFISGSSATGEKQTTHEHG